MTIRYTYDYSSLHSQLDADVVIVGSGLAGLYTALQLDPSLNIIMLTKASLSESNTEYAQGGIAAAICSEDSPSLHRDDTINAGHGLCEKDAVDMVVSKGPSCIQDLLDFGVKFDQSAGEISLTREGAHSRRRVLHAKGDGTGKVIRETLTERLLERPNIRALEQTFAIDIVTEEDKVTGVTYLDNEDRCSLIKAPYVIVASGGASQLYSYTTNPEVSTGDGIAMAYRAGAILRDMEFVQFHPTALYLKDTPRFLISEAVRGEGAVLKNPDGEKFMGRYHLALKDLAPRDVVSRAMAEEMEKFKSQHLYLDVSHLAKEKVAKRFPTIYKTCQEYGLDLPKDLIPVAPAAHYFMGGIAIDFYGRTNIKGLLSCGEATSSGLHGANRLASNSLLEAIVYGDNIATYIKENPLDRGDLDTKKLLSTKEQATSLSLDKKTLTQQMWDFVGIKRNKASLTKLNDYLKHKNEAVVKGREELELNNMLTIAKLVCKAALLREESRGGHYREDFPQTDKKFKGHINFNQQKNWFSPL
ncbi:L-aspartate oxidase [Proteinivorax hydrogeniformans]|uniref:L-aspartate oxidase n=1 Tax=Proteinivorax hydrogeniformans TaxID=1826727 RepID=A0AAU8HTE7_9FIRM